jgi:type IV secretory pathway TraG/TraD family ATPase VirD4
METITRQQKNTSFGANEFRDGISYNEHQQKKPLIEPSDLSSLATGSCYVFLPEPDVRMAKIKVPYNNKANKHDTFLPKGESLKPKETNSDTDNEDSSKNDKDKATNAGARKTESTNHKENSKKQKNSSIDSKKEENKNSNKNAGAKKDKMPHERNKPKRRVIQKKQDIQTNLDNKIIKNI